MLDGCGYIQDAYIACKGNQLFMPEVWLGVIDINDTNHIKRYKQRINACSIVSNKMMGLVLSRKRKNRNRTTFLRPTFFNTLTKLC